MMKLRPHFRLAVCALPLLALAAPSLAIVGSYTPTTGAQPNISERQAVEIGLNRVPQGTVQTARLEDQNGRPVWFMDIAGYNGRSRQEILIDANSGKVLSSHARDLTGPSTAPSRAG